MTVQVMQPAPDFALQGYDRTSDSFKDYKLADYKGKWVCLFFYPLDFTFVCPTELVSFNDSLGEFESRNCQVLTASTDSKFSHKGWCDADPQLADLKYPMLADGTHQLSKDYGVLKDEMGIALRGIFLIDPEGNCQWLAIHSLSVGRNVEEVLRVLDALQTGENVPCNWKKGEKTL